MVAVRWVGRARMAAAARSAVRVSPEVLREAGMLVVAEHR